jgi:hypothetical protein
MQKQKVEFSIEIPKSSTRTRKELIKNIKSFAKAEVIRFSLLEKWNRILSKSKLTERDAIRLGNLAKKDRFLTLKKMGVIS